MNETEIIQCPFDLNNIDNPGYYVVSPEVKTEIKSKYLWPEELIEAFCRLGMVNCIPSYTLRMIVRSIQNNYRKMHGLPMRRQYRKH